MLWHDFKSGSCLTALACLPWREDYTSQILVFWHQQLIYFRLSFFIWKPLSLSWIGWYFLHFISCKSKVSSSVSCCSKYYTMCSSQYWYFTAFELSILKIIYFYFKVNYIWSVENNKSSKKPYNKYDQSTNSLFKYLKFSHCIWNKISFSIPECL